MCFPLAIPLALMAGGTVAQYFGNRQADKAQNRTYRAERQRQEQKSQEQQALFDQSVQSAGKINNADEAAAATDNRRQAFIQALDSRAPSQDFLPGNEGGPQVIADVADDTATAQRGRSEQGANAMANLTGFGDQLFRTNIDLGRNAQGIGQLGRDKFYSAQVLDAEMRAAANKGSFLRGLGGLASSIGSAMIPGAAGMGAAGSAAGAGGGLMVNGQAIKDAFQGAFGRSGIPMIPVS